MDHTSLASNASVCAGNFHRAFRSILGVSLVGLILCSPSIAPAFGPGGHMMVAHIAYGRLNPRAKAQAAKLLALPIDPPTISAQSKDFVSASHWADDLRPFPKFNSYLPLHFIDLAFWADGTALPSVPTPNIITALQQNVKILRTSKDDGARAQALRFIIHFVGDIHQPLHCAARVDKKHPEGDQGGNLFPINVGGTTSELHSYWDSGIRSFPKTGPNYAPPPLQQIAPEAAKATSAYPPTDPGLKLNQPFAFKDWSKESLILAKTVTYTGIVNGGTPSASYNAKSVAVLRKRVAWGGYRLAALLNTIWT